MSGFRFSEAIETLHARARSARGLDDFGQDDYQPALERLCRSLDVDARLTPVGELAMQAMITDALEARLLCEAGHARHPEAAGVEVRAPIVIVGLPRTGTTALHHLLAQAPRLQALEHWLMRAPKPRPPRDAWADDPDYRAAAARVDAMFARSPEMRAIHEIEAELPDECWNLFAQNFIHSSYQANADVEGYAAWWLAQDLDPVYRRHRRNVQLIGLGAGDQRWLFKDSTHLFDLDALLRVYPDARVVQTHRDPVDVIPSVCSLCSSARSALNRDADPVAFGRATLALWGESIDRMMASRARHDADRFYDLTLAEFTSDPIATARRLFEWLEEPWDDATEASLRAFREANPKGRHGAHHYAASDWGLDAGLIRDRFRAYTEAYDVSAAA